jgi:hypothetical protein
MKPEKPEILAGGNSNLVVKEGSTVVRQTGHWSPFVHSLLRYLTANGFTQSPVLLETTDTQERVSFLAGEVGNDPLKPYMQSDAVLIEAAQLLRRFHDLTQHFVVPPDATFLLPPVPGEKHEVICHNDFAPYNCVFNDEHIAGLIDFDTVAPGSRIWDVAYAVYRFVPLMTDAHCVAAGWQTSPDRSARLHLVCDAYGLADRSTLVDTVLRRIEALVQFMRATSSNLEHIPVYVDDMQYIRENFRRF